MSFKVERLSFIFVIPGITICISGLYLLIKTTRWCLKRSERQILLLIKVTIINKIYYFISFYFFIGVFTRNEIK